MESHKTAKSPIEQRPYIAQQNNFFKEEEKCDTAHTTITPEFMFVGQIALYAKCIQANYQRRVFCFPTMTNKKAEDKANNTNKMKDTLQESSGKKKKNTNTKTKKHHTLIMLQEQQNLESTSFFVISAILQKPSSNKLCISSFNHRQDTTTVTDYLGAPLTKKYSYIKYTHGR